MAGMVDNPVGAALQNPVQQSPASIPAYQRPMASSPTAIPAYQAPNPMQQAPAQQALHAPQPYIPQQPQQAQYQPAPQQQQQQQQQQWQQFMQYMQQMQQQQGQGNPYGAPQNYGPPGQPQPGQQQGPYQRMQAQQQNPMLNVRPPPTMNPMQPAMMPRVQSPFVGGGAPSTMSQNPFQGAGVPTYADPNGTVGHVAGGGVGGVIPQHPNADPNGTVGHVAGGGMGLAMSDATQKIISQRTLADDFLDHMKPYTYKYKNPAMEPRSTPTGGTYLGVMAQDLERIPHLGPQIVVDTPHGKMVDQKTALSATMAGLARLNERVHALEHDAVTHKGGKK